MRALVLSGGGSRGSWECGVLKYMGEKQGHLNPSDRGFPIISGTSVGSINAAGLSMYPTQQFPEATKNLVDLWDRITKTSDVWEIRKPLGIPALWKPSLGTNDALAKFLSEVVDLQAIERYGIILRLPAVDLETGSLVVYDTGDLVQFGIAPILASASFPVAFPPVDVAAGWMTDGGVIDMAPLGDAIDAGADDITVLVTRSPKGVAYKNRKEMKNAIEVALRVVDIMTQTVLEGDLKVCSAINKLVEAGMAEGKKQVKVDVIGPSKPLGDSLDFSGELMQAQISQGYEDAKRHFAD